MERVMLFSAYIVSDFRGKSSWVDTRGAVTVLCGIFCLELALVNFAALLYKKYNTVFF